MNTEVYIPEHWCDLHPLQRVKLASELSGRWPDDIPSTADADRIIRDELQRRQLEQAAATTELAASAPAG